MATPLTLLFATNNAHKVAEVKQLLPANIQVLGLKEAGINIDIAEPFATLAANAHEKASVIAAMTGNNCLSEDTGLEVDALMGAPGVRSARFAGDNSDSTENIALLLRKMERVTERKARFRTVMVLIWQQKSYQFEGVCEGTITLQAIGTGGFGYDPVFMPMGSTLTFGQMANHEKAIYSHRAKALQKLVAFLNTLL